MRKQMKSNGKEGLVFRQPKTFEARRELAKVLVERLGYRIPVAIDTMDGRAEAAFGAWPERIYILRTGGRILYKGDMGPLGFLPEKAEASLARILG